MESGGPWGRLLQVSRGAMAYDGAQPKEAVAVEKREWAEDTLRGQTCFCLAELKYGNSEVWHCLEISLDSWTYVSWDLTGKRGYEMSLQLLLSLRVSRGSESLGYPAELRAPKVCLHCEFAQSSCLFLLIDINDSLFPATHRRCKPSYSLGWRRKIKCFNLPSFQMTKWERRE